MPLRAAVAARVRVNRQEQIGVLAIGDRGSLLERNVDVGAARQHDLDAELLLQQLLEPQRHVQRQRRFGQALGDRAGIAAAVARDRSRCATRSIRAGARSRIRPRRLPPAAPATPPAAVSARRSRRRRRAAADGAVGAASGAVAGVSTIGMIGSDWRNDRPLQPAEVAQARRLSRRDDGRADDARGSTRRTLGVDHQAERAVEREDAVLRDFLEIEHDADGVVRMAANANLVDDVAAVGQHLVHQRRRQLDVPQVEEQPRWTGQPLFAIGHFLVELEGDAHGVGQHDSLNRGQRRALRRRRNRRRRLAAQRARASRTHRRIRDRRPPPLLPSDAIFALACLTNELDGYSCTSQR